jgi:hypothetical protein
MRFNSISTKVKTIKILVVSLAELRSLKPYPVGKP